MATGWQPQVAWIASMCLHACVCKPPPAFRLRRRHCASVRACVVECACVREPEQACACTNVHVHVRRACVHVCVVPFRAHLQMHFHIEGVYVCSCTSASACVAIFYVPAHPCVRARPSVYTEWKLLLRNRFGLPPGLDWSLSWHELLRSWNLEPTGTQLQRSGKCLRQY